MNFLLLFLIIYELVLHSNFEVKFIRRQTNVVALALARTICSGATHNAIEISPTC